MEAHHLWLSFGVSDADLEAKAVWLARDHCSFPGALGMYFRTAASLIRFSRFDFALLPLALFQTVIGLEKTLRLFYPDEEASFKTLLARAVQDGVITDRSFSSIQPLREEFRDLIGQGHATYSEQFASLIPALRNRFFHGEYRLHSEFLPLALQVREAVDALMAARSMK